jgi:protein ImuB
MRRVLSLWFPRLPIDRIERKELSLRDVPFAFVAETGNRIVLEAANDRARREGVRPGTVLADARAACPNLVTRTSEPRADARLLRNLARWMERTSPLIAFDAPDGLFSDTAGTANLFGGEVQMTGKIVNRLERLGLAVRAALADTPGAAWALARYGSGCTVVDQGANRAALAPLPMAALRIGGNVVQSCRRLGLKTVSDLYPLPRSAIASRFGLDTLKRLDQALGHDKEPLKYVRFVPRLRERMPFAEPIAHTGDVEAALRLLLDRLCTRLEREQKGARLVSFAIERVDGTRQKLAVATVGASRAPQALFRLFRDKLDSFDAGFGIERVSVEAERCEPLTAEQVGAPETATAQHEADGELIDRLVNRFGHDCVLRAAPAESHLPECAWSAWSAAGMPDVPGWIAQATARPLRLLVRPEPLAAEGGRGPGVPPHAISRYGRTIPVAPLSGPERIEPEWWHDDPAWRSGARDYWWVRGEDGSLLWLFRTGGAQGAWFLHGLGG